VAAIAVLRAAAGLVVAVEPAVVDMQVAVVVEVVGADTAVLD
jgi:hypothetical protein